MRSRMLSGTAVLRGLQAEERAIFALVTSVRAGRRSRRQRERISALEAALTERIEAFARNRNSSHTKRGPGRYHRNGRRLPRPIAGGRP